MRLVVTALTCLVGVASCSLLTPLDGLSNGSTADSGTDAPPGEAGGGDGGDGGADGGDAGARPFCETQANALLCEDFDKSPLPGAFSEQAAVGTEISLDPTLSTSPRYSLSVVMPKDTGTSVHYGGVSKSFTSAPSVVTLNVKVRLVKVPTRGGEGPRADLLTLECGNEADKVIYSLIVQVRPSDSGAANVWLTSFVPSPAAVSYLTTFAAMPVGAWQELRVVTNWSSRSLSLHAINATGPVELGTATLSPPGALTLPPPSCTYSIGLYSDQPQDGWSVRFDDVLIRTQ